MIGLRPSSIRNLPRVWNLGMLSVVHPGPVAVITRITFLGLGILSCIFWFPRASCEGIHPKHSIVFLSCRMMQEYFVEFSISILRSFEDYSHIGDGWIAYMSVCVLVKWLSNSHRNRYHSPDIFCSNLVRHDLDPPQPPHSNKHHQDYDGVIHFQVIPKEKPWCVWLLGG